jgi:hypothetical protein
VPERLWGYSAIGIEPGNSPFARWLRKNGIGKSEVGRAGVWIRYYHGTHSYDRAVAYATEFARVINFANLCIEVSVRTRLSS